MNAARELEWERAWWGDAANTFHEEQKQLIYARLMGLALVADAGRWPVYDLGRRSVLDLGGGPVSMLLKTRNGGSRVVVDPCPYPDWISGRYAAAGIDYHVAAAEDFKPSGRFDECWIYNVLQHVRSPRQVVRTACLSAGLVRIFEWIETPAAPGHPHTLHAGDLDRWLDGRGVVTQLAEGGCHGLAYSGAFPS